MSTDAFAPAVFPRLLPHAQEEEYEERARVRGYADGHAEGYRAGLAQAQAEAERARIERARAEAEHARAVAEADAALHAAARGLTDRMHGLQVATDARVQEAAIELAEHILAAELRDAEHSARMALHRALAAVEIDAMHEIRLHPQDLRTLADAGAEVPDVVLVADPALQPGDAVATVPDGMVDARIAQALERARRALEEATE